ncbi:MAG: hypothetical protein IJG45_08020 [Oscillospiraceae bacterium]|nr:hypothetical protein [Oscillospiraceae bacterium]
MYDRADCRGGLLFALTGCATTADNRESTGPETSAAETDAAETDASESQGTKDSAVVTIAEDTFPLKSETELNHLHYLENYVDFMTDRVGNTKSMSFNYAGDFSFEVRVNCEEEHSLDEVKAMLSEYEEMIKAVNGVVYSYYEFTNDLRDTVHYYLYEYENQIYSIIFFLGKTPGNIEEVFMNNVRFE